MKTCSVEGCDRPFDAKMMCKFHYHRAAMGRDLLAPHRSLPPGEWSEWAPNSKGYVRRTRKRSSGRGRETQLKHRFVMSKHLGRELFPDEEVHHKNGDKGNNELSNLELWSTSHPAGQRVEDKVAWAWEIIKRYEGETK